MKADINIPSLGLILLAMLLIGIAIPAYWWLIPLAILMIFILVMGEASGGRMFRS